MEQIFQQASEVSIFIKRGDRVKLGRWQSFFRVAKEWQRFRTSYLLVLLWLGLRRGW